MIYTKYGSPVAILGVAKDGRIAIDTKSGSHLWATMLDLRADGGAAEIDAAVKAAGKYKGARA